LSVKVITWAWTVDLPATDKLILIALADHANDEEHTCYPSITHLSYKCGMTRRTVITSLNRIEEKGIIKKHQRSRSETTLYWLNVGGENIALCKKKPRKVVKQFHHSSEADTPQVMNDIHHGGESDAGGGESNDVKVVKEIHPEPSLEPSVTITSPDAEKPAPSKYKYSDKDILCAQGMFKKIQEINPGQKEPNFESWANDIRLMRERDKRTHEEIKELFLWANNDNFWRNNILCPSKLRTQWDQLTIKKNAEVKGNGTNGKGYKSGADYIAESFETNFGENQSTMEREIN